MADSFQSWIGQYLIDIAETHGADLTAIPYFEKKKKVQLVEFITYNLNTQDDCIWGKISDKEYKIPVRFTKEAMSRYNSLNTRRLTEHKTALISITDFQPFFARIPLANNKGMSQTACMALNIKSFSIIGSTGEAEWGRPQDIETNADLLEWSKGLRKDGGEGNVLMDRRKEREKAAGTDAPTIQLTRKPVSNGPPRMQTYLGSKAPGSKKKPALPEKNNGHLDLLKEYEKSWRSISLNAWTYALKPPLLRMPERDTLDNVMEVSRSLSPVRWQCNEQLAIPRPHALDLSSSQPERGTPPHEQSLSQDHELCFDPTTPSDWSSSVSEDDATSDDENQHKPLMALSFEVENQFESASGDDSALPNTFTTKLSSHLSPPTPAQRPKRYAPPAASSPPLLSASFPPQTPDTDFLPAAMQPAPNYTRQNDMRRVPHPTRPPPESSTSDPAHILVPNSDTSGTASQPQSQSQLTTQSIISSEKLILRHTQEESEEQCSNVDNNFHPLFVSPSDDPKAADSDTDDESNDKGQSEQSEDEFDQLQEEEGPLVELNRSIVPNSQEGQLDEDDAHIDEMLFGSEEYTAHFVKEAPPPTIQTPTESSTTIGTEGLLHNLVDNINKVPTQVSQQLPHSWSKDAPQSPVLIVPARTIAAEQSSGSNITPQHILVPSDMHPVEHNKEAWATPSFIQNKIGKKKESAFSLEISGRNGSSVGANGSPSRTSRTTKKSSISFLSGTDAIKINVAPNKQPSSSKHIHTSTRTVPEIQGEGIRAQAVETTVSSRDSLGLTANGRRSHKRRREASLDIAKNGSERKRQANMESLSGPSPSRQKLDRSKDDSKLGEDATLWPTQKGGNAHLVIKDEPFSGLVVFAGGGRLKGFQVDLDGIPYDEQNGWPFSWRDLERVLLQTGRKRDMEQKRKL